MGNKISVSTSELRSQASRLSALSSQMEELVTKTNTAIKQADASVAGKFKHNMFMKMTQVARTFAVLQGDLNRAAGFATKSAESFENVDTVIRREIGDSFPDNVKNAPSSGQTVVPLEDKECNGAAFDALKLREDYPDQAPMRCYDNAISIGQTIMSDSGKTPTSPGAEQPMNYDAIAEQINSGKPVMFHFLHGGSGGQHWIVAAGVKKGTTPPHSVEDFLFVDAYDGKTVTWDRFSKSSYYVNANPVGYKCFG